MSIDALRESIRNCSEDCPFRDPDNKPLVLDATAMQIKIMFVGENTSWADEQEIPFSENTISGRAFRKHYIEPLGLHKSDIWITDLFKCRYPKPIYHNKVKNDMVIQEVASKCARLWLTRELALAKPVFLVTLSDKQVYQRLRRIYSWETPHHFSEAVGRSHDVKIEDWNVTLFPMVHPDVSRPVGDEDNRKKNVHEKWAPLHSDLHIPELRDLLASVP
jgi:uracil-DNA glycosylase family 4